MLDLFREPRADRQARRRLEAMMRAHLGFGPDDVVRASEVACGAVGCGDVVTSLLVMRTGRGTEVLRATRPYVDIGPGCFVAVVEDPAQGALPLRAALARLGR